MNADDLRLGVNRNRPLSRKSVERAFNQGLMNPKAYLRATLSLEPAGEILAHGDAASRVELIREMTERADAIAFTILQRLTTDDTEIVRVHASQALAVLEAECRERIRRAENAVYMDVGSGQRWFDAGEAHLEMARVKESVAVLRDYYLQLAVTAFGRALQHEVRTDWMLALAEAEELGRQWARAEATARKTLDRDPFHVRTLLLLARLAYRAGRIRDARAYMRRLSSVPNLSPEIEDAVLAWVEPNGVPPWVTE